MSKIYIVYVETSDQCGTSKFYKAFKNEYDAKDCCYNIKKCRTYIKEEILY